MSNISAYFYVMLESKSGWKKNFRNEIEKLTLNDINQIHFGDLKSGFPGWKSAVLSGSYNDYHQTDALLDTLIGHGFRNVYVECVFEQAGESTYTTILNKNRISFGSREEIEKSILQTHAPTEPNFLSVNDEDYEKLLIKLKPRSKGIQKKLVSFGSNYIHKEDRDSFRELCKFINEEANKYLKKEWEECELFFPTHRSQKPKINYKIPPKLAEGLCYIFSDDNHIYLGFRHENLAEYVNTTCNEYGGQSHYHAVNIVESFGFLSKAISAKCRLRRFREEKEGYFFSACGAMYYREQIVLPEFIWGEAENP